MSIVDSNGTIHIPNRTGRHTACRTYIKPHWQPTDAPVTCAVCRASTVYAESLITQLGSRLVNSHVAAMWQIEVVAGVIIEKPRDEVLAWCERRIESRKTHVNKALAYCGGPGSNSGLPARATKV